MFVQFLDNSTYKINSNCYNYLLTNFAEFQFLQNNVDGCCSNNIIPIPYLKQEFEPYIKYLNDEYDIFTAHIVQKVAIAMNDDYTLGKLWHQILHQDIHYYLEHDYYIPFYYLVHNDFNFIPYVKYIYDYDSPKCLEVIFDLIPNIDEIHLVFAFKFNSIKCLQYLIKYHIKIHENVNYRYDFLDYTHKDKYLISKFGNDVSIL